MHCRGSSIGPPRNMNNGASAWWEPSCLCAVLGWGSAHRGICDRRADTGTECKMAHSCRSRFPARPGGSSNSGTGRRAGRVRVTASLRSLSGPQHPSAAGLAPGFDAALQVSSVIGSNLQKFRDVLGESSDSSSGEVSSTDSRLHQQPRYRAMFRGGANGLCPDGSSPPSWR